MIHRLKRRYLIANMTLLTGTLFIGLSVFFLLLYRAEVQNSYALMQTMLDESASVMTPPPAKYNAPIAAFAPSAEIVCTEDEWYGDWAWNGSTTLTTTDACTNYTTCTSTSTQSVCHWHNGKPYYHNPYPYVPPYWIFPPDDPQGNGDIPPDWTQNPPRDDWWVPPYQPPAQSTAPATTEAPRADTTAPPQTTGRTRSTNATRQSTTSERHWTTTTTTTTTHGTTTTTTTTDDHAAASIATTTGDTVLQTTSSASTTSLVAEVPQPVRYVHEAYVACVDEDGTVASYAGSLEEQDDDTQLQTVHRAVQQIRTRDGGVGSNGDGSRRAGTLRMDDVPYRYIYQPDASGAYHLVLLNRTLELSTVSRLLFIFLCLAVFGLLCVFGMSVLLANWTVRPIATAWEKQKQFVADASHELKTPLAVIAANTEVILANPTAQVTGQSKWLNYIKSETMRMSKLITNLLTVARMEHPKAMQDAASLLRLSELVSNVCLNFESVIYEHGKTLNTILQKNVSLCGEEDAVKQLLSILLDNAVLHSVPHAQITVSLSQDTQGKVRLAVANTAVDIPQEQLAHLFDRFYRLDTQGSPNGSGLGLSIAKSIVRQMHGTLTACSENHVVTFVATFPA